MINFALLDLLYQYNRTITSLSSPNMLFFSSFDNQGTDVAGNCSSWLKWKTNQLILPSSSQYFTSIQAYASTYNVQTFQYVSTKNTVGSTNPYLIVNCTNATAIQQIVSGIQSGVVASYICDSHTWRVNNNCTQGGVVCVDCDAAQCNQTGSALTNQMNPCQPNTQSISYYILALTTATRVLYPQVYAVSVAPQKNSIIVTANVSSVIGSLYCTALSPATTLLTAITVQTTGSGVTVFTGGLVNVTISGLQPQTAYSVYCYTADLNANYMPLAAVLATQTNVTTACCRSVLYTSFSSQILAYVAGSGTVDTTYQLALDSQPPTAVTINITAVPMVCSGGFLTNGTVAIYPSSFTFSPTSLTLTGNFILRGSSEGGCYTVTAYDPSYVYVNVSAVVYVVSVGAVPSPPALASAIFSSDGSQLTATLTSSSDQGQTTNSLYTGQFPCSSVLDFNGSATALCVWTSPSQVIATPVYSAGSALLVGGPVTLLGGTIKASCTATQKCSYANATTVPVSAPVNPLAPVVIISAPSQASSCSDLTLDATGSQGSAGRPWTSIVWSVSGSVANISTIQSLLRNSYASTSVPAVIPSNLLSNGVVTFLLQLTNFLGQTSIGSTSVSISTTALYPTVIIPGPQTVLLTRAQTLSLFASVSLPPCASHLTGVLVYTWSVYAGSNYASQFTSKSRNPLFFKLDPYTLDVSTVYTVKVTVSSTDPGLSPTSAQVTVQLQSLGVVAVISGGSIRSLGYLSELVLDASTSVDLNYPSTAQTGSLVYHWTCSQVSPNYGAVCPGFNSFRTNSSTYQAPASALISVGSTTTVLAFTIFTTNSGGASSSTTATVSIVNTLTPTVTVNGKSSGYHPGDIVFLTGSIATPYNIAGVATWSSPSITLSRYTITSSLQKTIASTTTTSSFPLALSTTGLTAGRTYTFLLSASYIGSNASSTAQIHITLSFPPSNGLLTVTPAIGTSNTPFTFQTKECKSSTYLILLSIYIHIYIQIYIQIYIYAYV